MKTISVQVVSSKPISLSKAASILSKFVSTDNGASHAVRAYLRRASLSFHDLVHLHRELKHSSNSGNKSKSITEEYSTQRSSPPDRRQIRNQLEGTEEDEEKKHKKKKKQEKLQFGEIGQDLRHDAEENLVLESERKKHRKKKEKERGEIDDVDGNGGQIGEREIGKKKDKSKSVNTGANGVSVEVESEGKMEILEEKRKKRGNGEVGDVEIDGLEVMESKKKRRKIGEAEGLDDMWSKKKKKRKTES